MLTLIQPVLRSAAVLCMAMLVGHAAFAQDAVIRKNIAERLPDFPKIDEISKTPIPGLFELRVGTDVFYTDEQGNHVGALEIQRNGTDEAVVQVKYQEMLETEAREREAEALKEAEAERQRVTRLEASAAKDRDARPLSARKRRVLE
mgnify:CR=1 FL=1